MRKKSMWCVFVCTFILFMTFFNIQTYAENCKDITDTSIPKTSYENNISNENDIIFNAVIPIAVEFLGAFLGVLTALGLNSHTTKKQYIALNNSLYNELLILESDLQEHLKQDQDFYRYLTPVWDINLAAGNLSILTNKHIDKKYIEIYSKIQYAQELEREYVHSKLLEKKDNEFLSNYTNTINNARIREAREIIILIGNLKKEEVK